MTIKERNARYTTYVETKSPRTPMWKSLLPAFVFGGIVCCIAQGAFDILRLIFKNMSIDEARSWALIFIVFLSILFTGIGIFDDLGVIGGAGMFLPISGFANAMASPSIDYKSEGMILGLGAKMFYVAGPVIVNGVVWSVVAALLNHLIFGIIFK